MDQCGYEKLHVDPFWNFFVFFKYIRHVSSVTFPVLLSPITRNSERRNWIFYDDGGFESWNSLSKDGGPREKIEIEINSECFS